MTTPGPLDSKIKGDKQLQSISNYMPQEISALENIQMIEGILEFLYIQ